jgi:hypothetical protein
MIGVLKIIFVISIMVGGLAIPANAQSTSEFGYKLHPEKLLENTVGDLQIFAVSNDIMVPKTIQNLKAISSDTEIIEILNIQEDTESFTKNIKIKAGNSGIATIVLAAPGFSSKEISLEVFNNNNFPTQILMKVTPEIFAVDGPKFGYVAVELATTGGLPAKAEKDTIISIETPNTNVIKLRNSEIIILQGEYYGIIEFDIVGYGDGIIFAETEGMKKVSQLVDILEPEGPLEIQLTIIPKTFSSFSGAKGYAIAQLVDATGTPVASEKDIELHLGVDNPDISINTSHDFEEVLFDDKDIVIKKGEYSAYTKFSPRPNLSDFSDSNQQEFEMFVSVDNYLARGDTFTVLHDEIGVLEGEGPAITVPISFLTTGKEEIIGVTYFETDIEVSRNIENTNNRFLTTITVPVMAKNDYELSISSSEENTVNPNNAIMKKGENAVILTGNTGTMVSESVELYIRDNDGVKTVSSNPEGPAEDDLDLTLQSLVPMILAGNEFPLIGYLEEGTEDDGQTTTTTTSTDDEEAEDADPRKGPTLFVEDGILTFSANELVNIESIKVKQNQEYAIAYQTVKEVGSSDIKGQIGKYTGDVNIQSHTTDPNTIHLGFINNMLVNDDNLATIQLLDSVGNPVYAKKDTVLQLVSNDESILKIPNEVRIKEGEYFNTFQIQPTGKGEIELAILSENFPLSKHDITIVDISPVISLNLGGSMNWNERIEAKLSISIPEIETSLGGYNVEWEVVGGEIRSTDEITNQDGIAVANVIANDKENVSITAKISGNSMEQKSISETAQILNMPIIESESPVEDKNANSEMTLDNTMLVLIIIPIAIAGALFFLKRTDRLDLITERIPIGDKVEEIKERISDIRNR